MQDEDAAEADGYPLETQVAVSAMNQSFLYPSFANHVSQGQSKNACFTKALEDSIKNPCFKEEVDETKEPVYEIA